MKVTVLGAGAWGTALGILLHRGNHPVSLWGHDPVHLEEMHRRGGNARYLPGIAVPRGWTYEPDLRRAISGSDAVVVAVPSQAMRSIADLMADYSGLFISVTKGIDYESGLTMGGVLAQAAPKAKVAALSGPTLALEVAKGVPTAIVAASRDTKIAQTVQQLFHSASFRVYTSTDLIGVEMGGALKNVVAIAAGVGDGFGFGDNSKAALLTRGIVEIRRLGVASGAQAETFAGLSGLGDLTVTCFSRLSRNRALGERLGRGEKLEDILASTRSVAEGYPTARSAYQLARRLNISTPIIDEVHAVLYHGKIVGKALQDLITRESKAED
ncbi:MAG TPA: NAD(P)H-dependent glycerol-3-phosphate dehydrogenase [Verrucomicrobiae bacterium]|nr:NAD(P)H-dependent glycerol-3-phosphate dehydrogenase [Verrucomicrobiae bacterium]